MRHTGKHAIMGKRINQPMEARKEEKKDSGTSKAALKVLIISAFDEEPAKPAAKKATVGSTVTPSEAEKPKASISLSEILRQAKNVSKK